METTIMFFYWIWRELLQLKYKKRKKDNDTVNV